MLEWLYYKFIAPRNGQDSKVDKSPIQSILNTILKTIVKPY